MNKNTNNDDEERQILSPLDTIEMPSAKTMMTTTNVKRKSVSAPNTPVTLTPSSSTVSLSTLQQENLPNNVSTMEQLQRLPPEFKSNDPSRPLQHTEENGETYQYSLRPMFYSVQYILLVELLERFCFYGINYTQTAYLTGVYDDEWNADYTAVQASSLVSLCIALAYTSPFWGATLADATPLGEYGTILLGGLGLYLPGLCLLCFTTIPFHHREFSHVALWWGMLFFWPMGTGMVKSVVNVFGAKQFHPLVQSADLETYYVNFYMCINVGALLGGILIPIVAQFQMTVAYGIPVVVLTLGMLCFVCGTNRYVRRKTTTPKKNTKRKKSTYCCGCIPSRTRRSNNLSSPASSLSITSVAKVCLLLVPFNIAYSQMSTTFIIQGTVLNKAYGILDAASMNNADTLSVLFFGYWIGNALYPWLSRQYNIKLLTTHKFALGSFLGVAALSWALLVEYKIHHAGPEGFSVLWQIPSYLCIGMGEIFAVSTAYEVAFTIAPPSWKGLASAVNLFFIGGVPNMICLALYQKCQSWFDASDGSKRITTLETYTQAHVYCYFILLWCIATLGVFVNLLPSVTKWVQQLEDAAAESIKTPKMTPKLSQRRLQRRQEEEDAEEQSPLVTFNTPDDEDDDRFEYGTCGPPLLNKAGSMRAGPTLLSQTSEKTRHEQEVYTKVQLYKQKKKKKLSQLPKTTMRRMLPPQNNITLNKEAPY